MTEIINSISNWFRDRVASPLYGTFIFSVITLNWKFFYVLFWQSEQKIHLPAIEYVQKNILELKEIWYYDYPQHILDFLIFPAILTFIILWFIPHLSNKAHNKYLDFYFQRKQNLNDKRLKYETLAKDTLLSMSKIKEQKNIAQENIEKNSTKEERWNDEFKKIVLTNERNLYALEIVHDIVYKTRGFFTTSSQYVNKNDETPIEPETLARLDTLGLIIIEEARIQLTEKGKYFLFLKQNLNLVEN